jgi:hypothetical protein
MGVLFIWHADIIVAGFFLCPRLICQILKI